MARYCDKCRLTYPEDLVGCPRCAGHGSAFGRSRLPALQPLSDPRIDLGSPVQCALNAMQPPSGASFVSWTALLQKRKKCLGTEGKLVLEPPPRALRGYVGAALLGFVLGCLVCFGLWAAGYGRPAPSGIPAPAPPTSNDEGRPERAGSELPSP